MEEMISREKAVDVFGEKFVAMTEKLDRLNWNIYGYRVV
jgi:hypothetical protein